MTDRSQALVDGARALAGWKGSGPLSRAELDRAAADLLNLQRGLTADRELIGTAYMDEKRRLASYLLFYWPVSWAQTQGLLEMAHRASPSSFAHNRKTLRILDLGAGPAPCAIAAADFFAARLPADVEIAITALDRSQTAIEVARALTTGTGWHFDGAGDWMAGESPVPRGPFDIILLGHVLNELHQGASDRVELRMDFLREALRHLAPDGILAILEPALQGTSRDLMEVRERLMGEGFSAIAPCLTDGPCPALALEGQSCHSEFRWKLPETVCELSKRTGLDKDIVKTAAFAFRRQGACQASPSGPSSQPADRLGGGDGGDGGACYRVVSEPMKNKAGRVRLLLCGRSGRFPLSIKPGERFPAEKAFLSLRRSDAILLEAPLPRETGLAVGNGTKISIL